METNVDHTILLQSNQRPWSPKSHTSRNMRPPCLQIPRHRYSVQCANFTLEEGVTKVVIVLLSILAENPKTNLPWRGSMCLTRRCLVPVTVSQSSRSQIASHPDLLSQTLQTCHQLTSQQLSVLVGSSFWGGVRRETRAPIGIPSMRSLRLLHKRTPHNLLERSDAQKLPRQN